MDQYSELPNRPPCALLLWVFALCAPGFCALAQSAPPQMRDFIGLNGHTVQFKPQLYRPVCRLVRDYHPVEWDLGTNTGQLPLFPLAKNGVDWNLVYGSWKDQGWTIDASLMFESVKQTAWRDLQSEAGAYGTAFAREFGPSGKRALVSSVEIGNEPGKWTDAEYSLVFKALAQGIRAGDSKMTIATCNVTAGPGGDYAKSLACFEKNPDLFDVLTVHTYAQLENWPTWRRSFPEDPRLPHYVHDVEAVCHWRDTHAPGKPVWVTEFGYDSTTKPAETNGDFTRWVGVTDIQQAQWLVRSLLVFSAMPVQRAYIYFFNDEDQPRLHSSSGITRHFVPKPSFYALEHLQRLLGECRFERMVTNQPGLLRVQEYQDPSHRTFWVAWSPTGEGRKFSTILARAPGRLVAAQRMPLAANQSAVDPTIRELADHRIEATIDESPLYLRFDPR